jgi:hypothetical protein
MLGRRSVMGAWLMSAKSAGVVPTSGRLAVQGWRGPDPGNTWKAPDPHSTGARK